MVRSGRDHRRDHDECGGDRSRSGYRPGRRRPVRGRRNGDRAHRPIDRDGDLRRRHPAGRRPPPTADAADDAALRAALDRVATELDPPEAVVYTAGVIRHSRVGELSTRHLLDTLAVNVGGLLTTAAHVVPGWRAGVAVRCWSPAGCPNPIPDWSACLWARRGAHGRRPAPRDVRAERDARRIGDGGRAGTSTAPFKQEPVGEQSGDQEGRSRRDRAVSSPASPRSPRRSR